MVRRVFAVLVAICFIMVAASSAAAQTLAPYKQTNLVSDIPGLAAITDSHLVNPWGIAASDTSPFWVADNGTGLATLYNGAGQPFPIGSPLVVTIPPPKGSSATTVAAPSGAVFNGTTDFVVSQGSLSGSAQFLFATEDGTISGWNSNVNRTAAILVVDNSAGGTGAVYKGLTLGSNSSGNFLFAANFRAGTVDVFGRSFQRVQLAGRFTDPNLPAGFAPFGIQNLGGSIFVAYAKQNATKDADVAGPGNGFVDVYDTNGNLLRRLASGGTLNSPWGLVMTPAGFGTFSNDLLVGNFGDGRINAFNPSTGAFLGQLQDSSGTPISIDHLWGLRFGNGGNAGNAGTLFFTAGIQSENHGLFGSLTPVIPSSLPRAGEPSLPPAPTIIIGVVTFGMGLALRRGRLMA